MQQCQGHGCSTEGEGGDMAPALPNARWVALGEETLLPVKREETKVYPLG